MPFHDSHHAALASGPEELFTGWRVISFVDPAGTGGDLAFTEGLSDIGLPELLLWARPTEGLDPGADWLLTPRERARLVNGWALDLASDRLKPGEEREERFDGGDAVARFRFSRPAFVSPQQHPFLPARARVITASWSLLRRASTRRPPAGLTAAAARRLERWIATADAISFGWRAGPRLITLDRRNLEVMAAPLLDPGSERFGPATRWVDARIAQVLAAGPEVVTAFLERLQLAAAARCEDCLVEDLYRLATRAQRNSATREASRVAQELCLAVTGRPGSPTLLWLRTLAALDLQRPPSLIVDPELLPVYLRPQPPRSPCDQFAEPGPLAEPGLLPPDAVSEPDLRTVLADGLELLLMAAVLADVAMPAVTASATGPWEWAVNGRNLPGRQWLARPAIRQAARQILAPATPDDLQGAVDHARQTAELDECQTVSGLLTGLQTTAAASAHPGALLRRDQRRGLPRAVGRAADHVAGQLVTAMAMPYRIPDESWQMLRWLLHPLAPDLPDRLPVEIP